MPLLGSFLASLHQPGVLETADAMPATQSTIPMVSLVRRLIEALNANEIAYCHWKSNESLPEALLGRTDIDLLIGRKDVQRFRILMSQLDFRSVVAPEDASFPAMEHYYGLDEETGTLAHVHAYFRVITGESLTKNYRLPVEEMLLSHTQYSGGVRIPSKSAELVVFTLRMMLKHASFGELLLLARERKHLEQEAKWLMQDDPVDGALDLAHASFPAMDLQLFSQCITALRAGLSVSSLAHRVILAIRLRSQLNVFARSSLPGSEIRDLKRFVLMLARRLTGAKKKMSPLAGGAVIAFVGSEATGKSTLLAEMSSWLGEHFMVKRIHAGKPKPTVVSVIPNLLLPTLRALFPGNRSGSIEAQYISKEQPEKPVNAFPLMFAVRSALLAYDRSVLLKQAYRDASNGAIVFTDRYPSRCPGAPDSPQLSHLPIPPDRYPIHRLLARIEARLYSRIPQPDLVISLSAPLPVVMLRNEARNKREPEEFVRLRHSQSSSLDFGVTPIYRINTDRPLSNTVLEVKRAIWRGLLQ